MTREGVSPLFLWGGESLIKTVGQPILNLITGEKIMEERLCRPQGRSLNEYFDVKDKNALWRRELHSVLQCIEESNGIPYNINVTAYSLLLLTKLPISWNGGIEIVEWNLQSIRFEELHFAIADMQNRGMTVWADDVTMKTLNLWLATGVNGIKAEINEIRKNHRFIDSLKACKKPVIIERIETNSDHQFVKEKGFILGQGYFYGAAQ